jgi:hypothetical protein
MALESTIAHKSTHAAGGADALTPADIGAAAATDPTIAGTLTFNGPGDAKNSLHIDENFDLIIERAGETLMVAPYGIASSLCNALLTFEESRFEANGHNILNWGTDGELSVENLALKNLGAPVDDNDAVRKVDGAPFLLDPADGNRESLKIREDAVYFYGYQNALHPDFQDSNAFNAHRTRQIAFCGAIGAAASANPTISGTLTALGDAKLNGITVGMGGGNVYTNTASGLNALSKNTTGIQNTASGQAALSANTTGSRNTASGQAALSANTTGSQNTANGAGALTSNTTGGWNTASGQNALSANTTGIQNTASGQSALYSNTTGNSNTANGAGALTSNTTGSQNTASGQGALSANTTGSWNTANGVNALSLNTGYINVSGFGYDAQVTGSSQLQLGNTGTTVFAQSAVQTRSDIRDKADIRDITLGLEFVNALRPVDFKWDLREDYRPNPPETPADNASEEDKAAYEVAKTEWLESVKLANISHDGTKKRNRFHHGLIAQEVKAVLDAKGIDFGGFQDHSVKGGDDVFSIGYEELIAPLIKAVQELSAEVAALKAAK